MLKLLRHLLLKTKAHCPAKESKNPACSRDRLTPIPYFLLFQEATMQKINEIAIVRHYKGKSRTILVGVYAKRKRTISKALVEKYGFTLAPTK